MHTCAQVKPQDVKVKDALSFSVNVCVNASAYESHLYLSYICAMFLTVLTLQKKKKSRCLYMYMLYLI